MSAYSGVDSDYWEAEVSAEGVAHPTEVSVRVAEGGDSAREVGEAWGQDTEETQDAGATGETALIVDDEPVV